ncbi:hypothetical protein PO909_018902 [Leuciscus waleckii]
MLTYTVSVRTGKQEFAGTLDHVYLTLIGTERCSDRTLMDKSCFQRFTRGTKLSLKVMPIDTQGVRANATDPNTQQYLSAPFCLEYKNLLRMKSCRSLFSSVVRLLLGWRTLCPLPSDDRYRLACKPSMWQIIAAFMFSSQLLIPHVRFTIADQHLRLERSLICEDGIFDRIKNLGLNKPKSLFQSSWTDIEDFQEIFMTIKNPVSEYVMQNWKKDFMFGYQFLNGCNPVMISKCTNLPDEFAVTQEMVKDSLDRGLTLQEELKEGNVYIADYAILEGVRANATDPNTQQYLSAPFCLLYKNSQNEIMPIAIQLSRQTPSGEANTVFLPSDDHYDWMLAKMWVKSSDFNVHQLVTHLLRTHLTSEVFAIAMYRQLAAVHPVYKLLIPHVRYTIAINTAAREKLICEDGIFDKANATGGTAIVEVIQKAMKTLTYKSLCFPEAMKARGVEDLPNYYYRDDGMMVWEAVKSFVSDVVKICYGSDETVQEDKEIQAFVQDVCFSGLKNCPKNCEFPDSLNTREQLVEFLTVVIFTASAQHAAVNFGQYDWFSWVPNNPSTMRKPPPAQKGQVDMKYIMESLPDRGRSSWHLGAVWALSQFQDNELFLGEYPDMYFTEQPVMEAAKTFRKKLAEVTNVIKSRNEDLKVPYWYLCPDRIPNSVAV